MLFRLDICFARRAVALVMMLASLAAKAASPSFFVTVNPSGAPSGSQLLLVTTDPFGYSVVTASNDQGGAITNSPGDAALDFSPDGTLHGSAGAVLSVINPATAAASNAVTLTNAAAGVTTDGAALAFGSDGTLYVSDGYTLYTANQANGQCVKIAPFHTNSAAAKPAIPIYGLATAPDGALFGGDLDLYTIDPATAAATWIGPICAYPGFIQAQDMAFGSDGNLYLIGMDVFGDEAMYSIDTNNAAITSLGALPGPAFGLVQSDSPAALAIIAQPASQTVPAGATVSFSVTATGLPLPVPHWYFDSNAIEGGTNFILTLPDVAASNAGSYFVVLTNRSGAVTSAVVTLTLAADFTFLATASTLGGGPGSIVSLSTNPPAANVLGGTDTLLTCLAFDTNGVFYGANDVLYRIDTNSWNLTAIGPLLTTNGLNLPPLTGMAFSPSNILYGMAGDQLFTISISTNPAQAKPVSAIFSGGGVFISAIAFGPTGTLYGGEFDLYTIEPEYGLISSEIGPLSSGEILGDMKFGSDGYLYFCGGSTANIYRLNPLTAGVSAVAGYPADFPGLSGLAFYPAAFDATPASITAQPASLVVGALGGSAAFSAGAAGAGPIVYQWMNGTNIVQDGSRIAGSATPSLTIDNLLQSDAGSYVMVVSNAFGSANSSVATLQVGAGPTIKNQPAASTRVVEGNNVTLSVTAAGTAPLLYQWRAGDSIIPGAISPTLTVSAAPLDGVTAPFYTVLIRNSFGVALSAPAEVIVLPNLTRPTVAIAVPAVNARTASTAISGAASASATQVIYWTTNINNGVVTISPPASAVLALSNAGFAWSATPALLPGSNILAVRSENQYSNFSPSVSRPFFYEVAAPLALTIAADTGFGTLAGKASVPGDAAPAPGAMLNIGEGYSITATPDKNCLFAGWTGSLPASANATLNFVMENDLTLEADFITNPFVGMAGTYNGLFNAAVIGSGAVEESSSGLISGLTVRTNGVYSGVLTLQGTNYSLSGTFALSSFATNSLPRAGGTITVRLELYFGSDRVGGATVSSDGWTNGGLLWGNDSSLLPLAAYTMLLPPVTGTPSNSPPGYGYALITNRAGVLSVTGQLADGTAFNQTVPVTVFGYEPFYVSLYGNAGLLTGMVDLDFGYDYQGQLTWIKPPSPGAKYYPAGFTNAITADYFYWGPPSPDKPALPFTTNAPGLLQISGGDLAEPLSFYVAVGTNSALIKLPSSPSTNSLTGSINPSTGLMTVTFGNGRGTATTTGTGAARNNSTGGGFFPGTTHYGSITLQPVTP